MKERVSSAAVKKYGSRACEREKASRPTARGRRRDERIMIPGWFVLELSEVEPRGLTQLRGTRAAALRGG
jgi:hypothetical protein